MSVFCTKGAEKNLRKSNFCFGCGNKLQKKVIETQTNLPMSLAIVFCTECGKQNVRESNFCFVCGHGLQKEAIDEEVIDEKPTIKQESEDSDIVIIEPPSHPNGPQQPDIPDADELDGEIERFSNHVANLHNVIPNNNNNENNQTEMLSDHINNGNIVIPGTGIQPSALSSQVSQVSQPSTQSTDISLNANYNTNDNDTNIAITATDANAAIHDILINAPIAMDISDNCNNNNKTPSSSDPATESVHASESSAPDSSTKEEGKEVHRKYKYNTRSRFHVVTCYGCHKKFKNKTEKDAHDCHFGYSSPSPSPSPSPTTTATASTAKICPHCSKSFKNGMALGGHLSSSKCREKRKINESNDNSNNRDNVSDTNGDDDDIDIEYESTPHSAESSAPYHYSNRNRKERHKLVRDGKKVRRNRRCIYGSQSDSDYEDNYDNIAKKHHLKEKRTSKTSGKSGKARKARKASKRKYKNKDGSQRAPYLPMDECLKDTASKEHWSKARKNAWNVKDKNAESYYYRFNEPGETTRKKRFSYEEHKLFIQRAKQNGVNMHWGLFSQTIPGRVGYICSNYWRKLIKMRQVKDENYWYNPHAKGKEKKWRFKWRSKINRNIDDELSEGKRFAFTIYDSNDPSQHYVHPKHPDFAKLEQKYENKLNTAYLALKNGCLPSPPSHSKRKSRSSKSEGPSPKKRKQN